jgi:Rad3-related DNA helicase
VGLKTEDVAYLHIPSPFPVENRPIHFVPVGSMAKDSIDKTLPVMAEAVRMILEKHPKDKGIIHTSNYRICQYILENDKSGRLLTHDSKNRDEVLKKHCECNEPTVLLSPSMMEGVDLADEASRFQILCKVPFPYLGDLVVKKRMERNKQWYPYTTAKSIIQSFGRSIRNEKDHAISYVLDSDWDRFYVRNMEMFPIEFRSSLKR